MTRAPVPVTAHQHALNAANMAKSVSTTLCGWTTLEGAVRTEELLRRMEEEIRTLKPIVRELKKDIQVRQREEAADRRVIERDRAAMNALMQQGEIVA